MGADNILQEERGGNSKIRFICKLINFFSSHFAHIINVRQPSLHDTFERWHKFRNLMII